MIDLENKMRKNKQEKCARILPFKKKMDLSGDQNVTEVTRSLFTETWKSYLDQTSMAALKLDHSIQPEMEEETNSKKAKLTIV